MPHLTAIDPEGKIAQLDTGEIIPITNMYDESAVEVSNPVFCRRGVAGPDGDGNWYPFTCDAEEGE